jgi:hypothetical protein
MKFGYILVKELKKMCIINITTHNLITINISIDYYTINTAQML